MSAACKEGIRDALRGAGVVPEDHPVFSADVRDMYKSDPAAARRCVRYIRDNFPQHALPIVDYDFVTAYDDWPFHNR